MKKIIIFLITIFISANICFADAASDLVNKIRSINSMTADFNQKLIDNQNDNNISTQGKMSLKKPQFFKWIITSPNNQQIVSNGKKLWIYDGDLDQLIIKKVSNNIAQYPYLILLSKNTDNIDKLFTVKEESNNNYILKPKNDEMINSIVIKFDNENKLKSLDISTSLNQFTQITFSNVKDNASLENSSFDFKTPKDTDVIDETKA
ncbi:MULTISPECIES: outer membrane lipoprotein chaperone LolA [unclassified Francisella]|uniref:outer membrane lipoprotein chaperone LolA n=1 Tax=unclassified Francisella TaxID=2610885 RepID=UPI002E31C99E|nr:MULTISPECIES: outer membrane lipoprotein chaperone LolA [unclassified Francisella]MED7820355.1 outer membrane lipoprotein chaperone LolA [Francisella sp. 19S2-4]MED7831192.1 outer membrane lipoprotein chaperone LolA [Francisella sp. 19S2-10]